MENGLIHNTPDYGHEIWQTCEQSEREVFALAQLKNTALFAKRHVPFYREKYRKFPDRFFQDVSSIEEFIVEVPELQRQDLSSNPSKAFIPENGSIALQSGSLYGKYRNFGTGGTTGKPVQIFHSLQDWQAMRAPVNWNIKHDFKGREDELQNMLVIGLYHGDHITNHIYEAMLNDLGFEMIKRASTKMDIEHNYELLQKSEVNGILAPPEDGSNGQTKGITLENILKLDARRGDKWRLNHKINPEFKFIFWSSMPMSQDLYTYIKEHLGIPYIKGHYGSTETCPTGATCPYNPLKFHLTYGPSLVAIKKDHGKSRAKAYDEGYLVVSKTGAVNDTGQNVVPSGTYILNYRTGDYGSLSDEKCACGVTTPVLSVYRKMHKEVKKVMGCQVD
jgi:phenylacetate-coenzyme A ligase PaaK-like adenylate-forming protein